MTHHNLEIQASSSPSNPIELSSMLSPISMYPKVLSPSEKLKNGFDILCCYVDQEVPDYYTVGLKQLFPEPLSSTEFDISPCCAYFKADPNSLFELGPVPICLRRLGDIETSMQILLSIYETKQSFIDVKHISIDLNTFCPIIFEDVSLLEISFWYSVYFFTRNINLINHNVRENRFFIAALLCIDIAGSGTSVDSVLTTLSVATNIIDKVFLAIDSDEVITNEVIIGAMITAYDMVINSPSSIVEEQNVFDLSFNSEIKIDTDLAQVEKYFQILTSISTKKEGGPSKISLHLQNEKRRDLFIRVYGHQYEALIAILNGLGKKFMCNRILNNEYCIMINDAKSKDNSFLKCSYLTEGQKNELKHVYEQN